MPAIRTIISLEDLGAVTIADNSPVLREPPRPPALRQAHYNAEFDFTGVFYDAFFLKDDNKTIRLVGPALLNLATYIETGQIEVRDTDTGKNVEIAATKLTHLKKVSRLDISLVAPLTKGLCRFDFGALGKFEVAVGDNMTSLFENRRVAFTLFKYEPLEWLVGWAEFNIKYHGADALFVAHNNCPHASSHEIMAALEKLEGLKVLVVMHWPYTYGPQAAGTGRWDSNFCQLGLFEQLRWRFFANAEGVLNSDIDELVVTQGHRPIFDLLSESPGGYVLIHGIWISDGSPTENTEPFTSRSHRHYFEQGAHPEGTLVASKWAIRPSQNGEENQWLVHAVMKRRADRQVVKQATLCHLRDLNVKWKHTTIEPLRECKTFSPLREAYKRIGWL